MVSRGSIASRVIVTRKRARESGIENDLSKEIAPREPAVNPADAAKCIFDGVPVKKMRVTELRDACNWLESVGNAGVVKPRPRRKAELIGVVSCQLHVWASENGTSSIEGEEIPYVYQKDAYGRLLYMEKKLITPPEELNDVFFFSNSSPVRCRVRGDASEAGSASAQESSPSTFYDSDSFINYSASDTSDTQQQEPADTLPLKESAGGAKLVPLSIEVSAADSKPAADTPMFNWANFAPPAGSWKCDVCLVRNGKELTKCAACETPKP